MSITTSLICNKFGGIRRKNAIFSVDLITASNLENIELYDTGINGGVGIRTANGNIDISGDAFPANEEIINVFESVQRGIKYFFVHTISATEGKVYLYNVSLNTATVKISGLAVTRVSCGRDFAQGYSDLFVFSNGVDWMQSIEIGATDSSGVPNEVNALRVHDKDGREIKGMGLFVYDGRLWVFIKNRLHYSVQQNINDFATSDIDVSTSAGYIEYVKDITAIYPYLTSLAVFFKDSSIQISGTYPYTQGDESPGGCAGYNALVFHGTDLFFYDNTKKGIFSFQQIVLGNKTLGNNIADEIQDDLLNVDEEKLNEIKTLSIVLEGKNEIWFYLPDKNADYSIIFIYDYKHNEWVKRRCQRINCFCIFDSSLYSGSAKGKLLKEYKTSKFDGQFIPHFYKCSPLNLGSNTTQKSMYSPPRIAFNLPYINNFFVKYIRNFNPFKSLKIKEIKAQYRNFLIYGQGYWGQSYYPVKNINAIGKLPNVNFKTLEIEFYTENENQNFAIRNIEFSDIEVQQI